MINCIILEDDELAAKSLSKIIAKIDSLSLTGHYYNPVEAKNHVDFSEIDLIFLDVEMPEITGLEFIKTLKNPPKVIVTTSRQDFAVGAFEIEAVDFILKPVKYAKVIQAVDRYNLLQNPQPPKNDKQAIFIKVDYQLVKLKFDEILWIEALGDYVGFHVADKRYVVKSTLTSISISLPKEHFVKVHRSYIVNTNHIKTIDDSSLVIQNKLIPISRGNRSDLLNKLNLLK